MQKVLLTFIVVFGLNIYTINGQSPVVLELFTSQGCFSCPAADDLLDEVKTAYDDDVIPLSYHVDYWNYIGWKDPFSKALFTEKQKLYSQKFNSSTIYTPQVVVNGVEHFVGSNESILKSKISEYSGKNTSSNIQLSNPKKSNNRITLNYELQGKFQDKRLRVALVIEERVTSVKRGENRNRILKNANIVIAEQYVKVLQDKGQFNIEIPSIVQADDKLRVVAILENGTFDILGAKQLAIH